MWTFSVGEKQEKTNVKSHFLIPTDPVSHFFQAAKLEKHI